jgi:hypothetical protein
VRIVGEDTDDFDAGLDLGIGRIDDAERRLAAGDVGQSGPDIDCHRHFRLDRWPHAEVLQCSLSVEPDRDRLDVAGCDSTIAGELGEIKPRLDVDVIDFRVFGSDQYQSIAE